MASKENKVYFITRLGNSDLDKNERIRIEGLSPIKALRTYFKEIGKDVEISNTRGWAANTVLYTAAVTYVNGVPSYGFNPSYPRQIYNVAELDLFGQLARIYNKKNK